MSPGGAFPDDDQRATTPDGESDDALKLLLTDAVGEGDTDSIGPALDE